MLEPTRCCARSSCSAPRSHPRSKRHCVRRKSIGEFIADLRQQSGVGVKRVLVARTLKRPRANWFSGDVDLFQRQAPRRASDVAP
jgi:hypothetical protein